MTYHWTPELWNEAQRLRALGMTIAVVANAIGAPYRVVQSRLHYESLSAEAKKERAAKTTERRRAVCAPQARVSPIRPEPPADILAARDARLATPPRDLTAILCGDPLPGYSALERMRGERMGNGVN